MVLCGFVMSLLSVTRLVDLIKSKQEFWAHCTDRKISHKGPYTNVGNYKHSVVKRLGWNLQKRCL